MLITSRFGLILYQVLVPILWKANYELNFEKYGTKDINWPITTNSLLTIFYVSRCIYAEEFYMLVSFNYIEINAAKIVKS